MPFRFFRSLAWFASLALLLFCPGSPRLAAAAPPGVVPAPRLVVLVSVDGLSCYWLEHYRPWYQAGLRRLLMESRVEAACRYRHLNTETGPGHSSLSTGAPPRVTGIVGNRWFVLAQDGSIRGLNCVEQPAPEGAPGSPPMFYRTLEDQGRLLVFANVQSLEEWESSRETARAIVRPGYGPRGETVVFDSEDAITLFNLHNGRPPESLPARGSVPGPGNLRVPTLGDRIAEEKGSRVVSLSAKDRSAILLAGRDPRHAAYWYDKDSGRFVNSPVNRPPAAAQAIVNGFNQASAGGMLPARFGLAWKQLPPPVEAASLPGPAANLLDFQLPSNGLGWDHPLTVNPRGYFQSLYYSPFVDDLVADLAVAFIGDQAFALGRRPAPDLLALSFSAQDVVSHSYGVESEENLDVLRRLDLHLGHLLEVLERTYPPGSVALALSADHGMAVIPEAEHARNPAFRGGRLLISERAYPNFLERLNRLLAEELCLEPGSRPLHASEGFNLIYNRPGLPMTTRDGPCGAAGRPIAAAEIDRALPGVLKRHFDEELLGSYLVSQRDRWPADDPVTEFVKNDFDPERSGDAFLIPRYGFMTHWDPARGTMHGTHYEYDTHVPLLFWGAAFKPGRSDADSTPYDLAPTLAELLGVALPQAVGRSRLATR